jgi:hypothetical protein
MKHCHHTFTNVWDCAESSFPMPRCWPLLLQSSHRRFRVSVASLGRRRVARGGRTGDRDWRYPNERTAPPLACRQASQASPSRSMARYNKLHISCSPRSLRQRREHRPTYTIHVPTTNKPQCDWFAPVVNGVLSGCDLLIPQSRLLSLAGSLWKRPR